MRLSQITGMFLFLFMFANITPTVAQDSWSLQRCVDYAMKNNITIKQQEVQKRLSELTLQQSRFGLFPNVDASANGGFRDGRFPDPNTNQNVTASAFIANGDVNLGGDLFGWFSKQNTIKANKYDMQANSFLLLKARNDVAFNVATAFLQILLKNEQVKVTEVQVQQTLSNLENTKKLVVAGSVPESNQADLEAQLATDSTSLVTAKNDVILAELQMKALLNLGFELPFLPEIPENITSLPVEPLSEMAPEMVYSAALTTYPLVKADQLKIKSAEKSWQAAKGQLYPRLSLNASVGSNYGSKVYDFDSVTNKLYRVPFRDQISNQFSKYVGLGLSVPIFNGWQRRTNVAKAKVNIYNLELTRDLDNQKLKQDIYTAHANAVAALQKFKASSTGVMAAQKAYDFATKRFNLGLMNTIDYITTQSKLFRAQIDKVSAQYDYIFKMKLLEFYRDQKISL
ncbi:TolC family protein [Chitinophaga solisilvae]|uniref:TolC family protein n=1 Tax=Chitinophaga solisilvae TaxID=1233460 RepID=A0A9Q5DAN4_9BACT|nr:TolC family protein [Chitinophaga solisilvae]NSL89665.1 TolC family protein [Chitinophaga solisilvae]